MGYATRIPATLGALAAVSVGVARPSSVSPSTSADCTLAFDDVAAPVRASTCTVAVGFLLAVGIHLATSIDAAATTASGIALAISIDILSASVCVVVTRGREGHHRCRMPVPRSGLLVVDHGRGCMGAPWSRHDGCQHEGGWSYSSRCRTQRQRCLVGTNGVHHRGVPIAAAVASAGRGTLISLDACIAGGTFAGPPAAVRATTGALASDAGAPLCYSARVGAVA